MKTRLYALVLAVLVGGGSFLAFKLFAEEGKISITIAGIIIAVLAGTVVLQFWERTTIPNVLSPQGLAAVEEIRQQSEAGAEAAQTGAQGQAGIQRTGTPTQQPHNTQGPYWQQ